MSEIAIRAKVSMPVMPNFVFLTSIRHGHLDDAIAAGTEKIQIDVADMDDDAVIDFCNAWTIAFTTHVKARRAARKTVCSLGT